jgi:hypothetical protein
MKTLLNSFEPKKDENSKFFQNKNFENKKRNL